MASRGFNKAWIGVLDAEGFLQTGKLFEINAGNAGAIDAKVSGLASPMSTVYASNIAWAVSAQGTSEVKLDLGVGDLDAIDGAFEAITGREVDEAGLVWAGSETKPPYVAVLLQSTAGKDGDKDIFVGLTKGILSIDGDEFKTQEDKGSEITTDTLSGTFIARADGRISVKARGTMNNDTATLEKLKTSLFPEKPVSP